MSRTPRRPRRAAGSRTKPSRAKQERTTCGSSANRSSTSSRRSPVQVPRGRARQQGRARCWLALRRKATEGRAGRRPRRSLGKPQAARPAERGVAGGGPAADGAARQRPFRDPEAGRDRRRPRPEGRRHRRLPPSSQLAGGRRSTPSSPGFACSARSWTRAGTRPANSPFASSGTLCESAHQGRAAAREYRSVRDDLRPARARRRPRLADARAGQSADPKIVEYAAESRVVGLLPADGLYEMANALAEVHREEGWGEKIGELFTPAARGPDVRRDCSRPARPHGARSSSATTASASRYLQLAWSQRSARTVWSGATSPRPGRARRREGAPESKPRSRARPAKAREVRARTRRSEAEARGRKQGDQQQTGHGIARHRRAAEGSRGPGHEPAARR